MAVLSVQNPVHACVYGHAHVHTWLCHMCACLPYNPCTGVHTCPCARVSVHAAVLCTHYAACAECTRAQLCCRYHAVCTCVHSAVPCDSACAPPTLFMCLQTCALACAMCAQHCACQCALASMCMCVCTCGPASPCMGVHVCLYACVHAHTILCAHALALCMCAHHTVYTCTYALRALPHCTCTC